MKFPLQVVFCAALVLGTARGDLSSTPEETASPQAGEGWASYCERVISETAGEQLSYVEILIDCTISSLTGLGRRSELLRANTTAERRLVMKAVCEDLPITRQCFLNLTSISETCQDQHQQKFFKIHRSNFESVIDVMCSQDGERYADVLSEWKKHLQSSDVDHCLQEAKNLVYPGTALNDTAVPLQIYRAVKLYKTCIAGLWPGHDDKLGADTADLLISEVLEKMRCATLEQEAGVLCAELDIVTNCDIPLGFSDKEVSN